MGAALFSLGKVVTVQAGIPVQVPTPQPGQLPGAGPAFPALSTVHAIVVEALPTNAGKTYIGVAGLNKATLAGVLVVLPVPTANLIPTFSISMTQASNTLSLADLWIDTDNSGEGVLISGVIA